MKYFYGTLAFLSKKKSLLPYYLVLLRFRLFILYRFLSITKICVLTLNVLIDMCRWVDVVLMYTFKIVFKTKWLIGYRNIHISWLTPSTSTFYFYFLVTAFNTLYETTCTQSFLPQNADAVRIWVALLLLFLSYVPL